MMNRAPNLHGSPNILPRLATFASIATLAVLGHGAIEPTISKANRKIDCGAPLTSEDYNSILCKGSREAAIKFCTDAAIGEPSGLDNSKIFVGPTGDLMYRISVREGPMQGCAPAGDHIQKTALVVRSGPDGNFKAVPGSSRKKNSTDPYNVNRTTPIRGVDCSDPNQVNTQAATRVTEYWRPTSRKWGKLTLARYTGAPKNVCPKVSSVTAPASAEPAAAPTAPPTPAIA